MGEIPQRFVQVPAGQSGIRSNVSSFEFHRCLSLVFLGTVAFAVWAGVLFTVPPHKLLTYIAFFVPFWIFVAAYASSGAYWFSGRRELAHTRVLGNSVRQGCLIASLIVCNLSLVAAHKWSILVFVASSICAFGLEVLAWVRASLTVDTALAR